MQLSLAPTAAGQAQGHRLEARRAAGQQRGGAARLVVRASQAGGSPPSLDTSKGLFTSNSSLLGPKPNLSGPGSPSLGPQLGSSKPKQVNLDEVPLQSGVRNVALMLDWGQPFRRGPVAGCTALPGMPCAVSLRKLGAAGRGPALRPPAALARPPRTSQ